MLIVISVSMLSVWGTVANVYCLEYLNVGINAYVYNGWRILSIYREQSGGSYLLFSILILMFAITLVTTYYFGIKSFVKGLKNLANNEDCTIFPYFLIIALVNYLYFSVGSMIACGAFGASSHIAGWGSILSAVFIIPSSVGIILYILISSFDKTKIPEFVGRIFIAVSGILSFPIMENAMSGYFSINSDQGIWNSLDIAINKGARSALCQGVFIAQFIVALLTIAVAFYSLVQSIFVVSTEFPEKGKRLLVAPFLLFIFRSALNFNISPF